MTTLPLQHHCPRCLLPVPSHESVCLHCLETDLADPSVKDLWAAEENDGDSWQGFVLGEVLGSGGMGTVYRARQLQPAREVALKMLPLALAGLDSARHRLLLEAEALAEVDHPGILPLYASGEADGRAWLAMKLAGGGTLAQRISEWKGRWRDIATLTASLAAAVQHAHGRGVIHRDLKPANILFDEAGRAYVADFGLAKWLTGAHALTLSAAVLGTPAYMAPEVAQKGAGTATTASDVYGLGAVLYELLTLQSPFSGPTPVETARRVVADELKPPRKLNPDMPRDLEAIVLKAMQREPARRYASAQALQDDLESWLAGKPITARHANSAERFWRWCRRHPLPAGLAAAVVVITAVSGLMLWKAFTRTREALTNAEDRVVFMTETLPAKIEPLGRLDVLDDVFADIATYYEKVDSSAAPDPAASSARRAAFQTQWAHILRRQGRLEEARHRIRDAITAGGEARAHSPQHPAACAALASAHRRMAELEILDGAFTSAFAHLEKAESVLGTGLKAHEGEASLVAERTEVLNEKAFGLLRDERPADALAVFDAASAGLSDARMTAETPPLVKRRLLELKLVARSLRGEALLAADQYEDAIVNYSEHLKIVSGACAAAPEDSQLKSMRLVALNRLADAHARLENPPMDLLCDLWREQEEGAASLCRLDPGNLYWRAEWGMAALSVARGADLKKDAAGAREWLEKVLVRLDGIPAKAHNFVLEARSNAALYLAENLHKSGDWTAGRDRTLAAMDLALQCLQDGAGRFDSHDSFASKMRKLFEIHHAHAPEESPALIQKWITLVTSEGANATAPSSRWWKLTEASLYRRAAGLRSQPAEAAADNLKALALRAEVLGESIAPHAVEQVLGDVLSAAGALAKSKPPPEAAAAGIRALIPVASRILAGGPDASMDALKSITVLLPMTLDSQAELSAAVRAAYFPQPPPVGSALEALHRLLSPAS